MVVVVVVVAAVVAAAIVVIVVAVFVVIVVVVVVVVVVLSSYRCCCCCCFSCCCCRLLVNENLDISLTASSTEIDSFRADARCFTAASFRSLPQRKKILSSKQIFQANVVLKSLMTSAFSSPLIISILQTPRLSGQLKKRVK